MKLADFGIAKAVGKSEKSATGIIKGKFAYMSPEQSQARPLDARSDLFSVGTVLYLLTTGRKPFDGPTDLDVIMQVRRARPEKPSALVKDLNPDVERFINRALRADPDKRWQSAEQMADRIDAILVKLGQPSGPAPLKRWLETLSARDGAKPPVADAAGGDRSQHRRRSREPRPRARGGRGDLRRGGSGHGRRDTSGATPLEPPAQVAKDARHDAPEGDEAAAAALAGAGARFTRWLRRMTIRVALIVVAAGGAVYLAWPHLPAQARQPVENSLRRLSAVLGQRHP